ncbi:MULTISPECIES: hypothetical protein [Thermus]|jgi:hypothetical protein|uniref:Uncharacterized protein n=3 Tax=Thermus TaxID=270 RepID=A0A0N0IQZ5_THESC|nr:MULTISPECIES: hypothetical protein [Thermus]ADW22081.1 hypothetical protein TSC_c14640 [Thermus scotoductus SA-01]KPD32245.1 hypothetical protein AN926_04585 [Thermus scotoductus]MBW6395213.1 hypothetical protein [Thermus brevis]
MIEALIKAQTEEERLLEFLRSIFLLIALVGFVFYGMEHWILDHWTESWQSRIPFFVSLVGFPLTLLMFFHRGRWVRYPFLLWMLVTVATGILGAYYHLLWNAQDAEVSLWSLKGFLEAFEGSRPVLAALAHTHVGAVAFVVGITIRD